MNRKLERLISRCRFVDAHTHSDKYEGSGMTEMIECVKKNGILTLSSATTPQSILASFTIHEKCPWILTAAGIHPWSAGEYSIEDVLKLESFYEQAHQISEIGMDGVWAPEKATMSRQSDLLESQLLLAEKYNKPVTLHTKSAEDRILTLLDRVSLPSILIHWFDGSNRQLTKFLDRGCFFTIPPSIIKNQRAREIMKRIPLHRLLPETDNPPTWPWLFDHPARADQIIPVIEAASALSGRSSAELMNTFRLTISSFLFPINLH